MGIWHHCSVSTKHLISFLSLCFYLFNLQAQDLRIVSTSGALTEITCELGFEKNLVGVDMTSTYPPSVKSLPKVGHRHQLNAEGLLSLQPTHVIMMDSMAKETLQQQLIAAGVQIVIVNYPKKAMDSISMIHTVAKALGKEPEGNIIAKKVSMELNDIKKNLNQWKRKPKALFIYARGIKTLYVGGTGTLAEALMHSAGAENALTTFASFQTLSAETIIQCNPDIIIAYKSGVEAIGGEENFWKLPGLSHSNAGRNKSLISLDEGALNFGPRVAHFSRLVHQQLLDLFPKS